MRSVKSSFHSRVLLLLLTLPSTAFAQPGIKAGVAVSGFQAWQDLEHPHSANDYRPFLGYEVDWLQEESYPDFGLQIGLFYTRDISERFAVQPEVYYSERGVHFDQTELYNSSYSLNVAYLEIPLLLQYKIPVKWRLKPSILGGPYAAFKLSADRTLEIWGERDTRDVSSVNSLDYGFVFAVESEFSVLSRNMMVELRLNWGLANVMNQPDGFTDLFEDAGRVSVMAASLMTGLRFSAQKVYE
jgi:hypothetical protein